MKIPDPKAKYDDIVMVLNYRRRPAAWELGRVERVSYSCSSGEWCWSYDVRLLRANSKGHQCLWLYVGDESVELARDRGKL